MSLEAVWKMKRKDQEGECMRYQMNDHTNLLVKHFEGVCHQFFHVFSHNSPGSIQSQNHPSLHRGLLNPNPPEGGRKRQKSWPFWWISDGTASQNTSLFWCFLVHNRCKPVAKKKLVHFLVVQHDLKTFKTKILVETGTMIKLWMLCHVCDSYMIGHTTSYTTLAQASHSALRKQWRSFAAQTQHIWKQHPYNINTCLYFSNVQILQLSRVLSTCSSTKASLTLPLGGHHEINDLGLLTVRSSLLRCSLHRGWNYKVHLLGRIVVVFDMIF